MEEGQRLIITNNNLEERPKNWRPSLHLKFETATYRCHRYGRGMCAFCGVACGGMCNVNRTGPGVKPCEARWLVVSV